MQPEIFDAISEQERTYWWFVSRRQLILDFFHRTWFRRRNSKPIVHILDVGCGTGAMLEDFARIPSVMGFGTDLSPVALRFSRERGQRRVLYADGTQLPFHPAAFECVVAMDVLEHIPDDLAAMGELWRVCAHGGILLITVPASPWLWTTRDERLHHKRRYTRAQLVRTARAAKFDVVKCSYYCAFFFPIMAAIVFFHKLLGKKPAVKADVPSVNPLVNKLCLGILSCEQWLMRWIDYPFGVSLFCVLRKGPCPE